MTEQPEFETVARKRWIVWYNAFAAEIGFSWNDSTRLSIMDAEFKNIECIMAWLFENQNYDSFRNIAISTQYYYSIRGYWDQSLLINEQLFTIAKESENIDAEVQAIASLFYIRSLQGDLGTLEGFIPRVCHMLFHMLLTDSQQLDLKRSLALYYTKSPDYHKAIELWQETQEIARNLSIPLYGSNRYWYAFCLYRLGFLLEALQVLQEAFVLAERHNYWRNLIAIPVLIASIYLDLGQVSDAETYLLKVSAKEMGVIDYLTKATTQRTCARLFKLRGNLLATRHALAEATDLFERLGMRRELAEAREELRRLDELGEVPAT